jgi:hypothetical protein
MFGDCCNCAIFNMSYSILPAQLGALVNIAGPGMLPPAGVPAPMLEPADVLDPPLPPIFAMRHSRSTGHTPMAFRWPGHFPWFVNNIGIHVWSLCSGAPIRDYTAQALDVLVFHTTSWTALKFRWTFFLAIHMCLFIHWLSWCLIVLISNYSNLIFKCFLIWESKKLVWFLWVFIWTLVIPNEASDVLSSILLIDYCS